MEPIVIVTGRAVPLDRTDVDTDQIIPSDWLKRVERTGFGAGLFSEWRDDRNFEGRQGRGGRTHLVSPAVAAATAVAGTFATPEDLDR